MRDKNQSTKLLSFKSELERRARSQLSESSLRTAVSDTPTAQFLNQEQVLVNYPRDFASLRSLAVVHWYLPEFLFWRIHLDLLGLSLSQFTNKQFLELQILLSSKENMVFYLFETKRYSSFEIFGNILGNQLQVSLKKLGIKERIPGPVARKERHRGYRDKGSLRPSHRWLESNDWTLTEKQNDLEERKQIRQLMALRLTKIVEETRKSQEV